jgi:ATP-dependent Zn protease
MHPADYLRGVAYHEAGHAVVAFALRLCVVSILLREQGAGNSETKTTPTGHLSMTDQIAVLAAGKAAERAFNSPLPDYHGNGDIEKALNLILQHHDGASSDEIELHMMAGHVRARALLAEHRDLVIRIAKHLREVRQVDAAEFLRLMTDKY